MDPATIAMLVLTVGGLTAGILGQMKSERAREVGRVLSVIIRAIEYAPAVEGKIIKGEVHRRSQVEGLENAIDREIERATGKLVRSRRNTPTPKPMVR